MYVFVCIYKICLLLLYKFKQIIQIKIARGCLETIYTPIILNRKIRALCTKLHREHGIPQNIICYSCEYN